MKTVAVLDYGASNLRSVVKALEHAAQDRWRVLVGADAGTLLGADKVVFPGQGAIRQCMEALAAKGLDDVLRECLQTRPFLGLCLGLQSLLDYSEEDGGTRGLGIIPGRVRRFPSGARDEAGGACKIPHMGWNNVVQAREHPLWKGIESGERFYFVHSYYVSPERGEDVAGTTGYILEFASALARDNLFAVQFHPEKSQRAGLRLLGNFLDW